MTAKEESSQHTMTRPAPMENSVTVTDDTVTANGYGNRRTRLDPKVRYFPESQFGGYSDIDQLVVFYTRVRSLLEPSFTVLDIGCGRGKHAEKRTPRTNLKILNDHCKTVIGIDVNPAARDNPFVDEFHLIDANSRWPLPDASVDLAVSDYVLEHVENPDLFLSECRRVIRPGGYLCMRTTNALSYFGVAAKVIPNRYHSAIVQRAYVNPRKEEDVFPTRFRCNTVRAVRQALDRHGFQHCVYGYQSDPAHFGFSRALYFLGVMHQRLAPRTIRTSIFVFARRR
jgi:SAM-dependent methyltransferase